MSIKIPQTAARQRLDEAFALAMSDVQLPESWTSFARQTFQMTAKTYTPALGTVLLARTVDGRIDPLSIKAEYGSNTYSLRSLCHEVLVPAARENGFSIRNTGREPINNQPFFRYEHMSEIDKVRDRPAHERFISGVLKVGELNQAQAFSALAAYLRVAIAEAKQVKDYTVNPSELTLQHVVASVEAFLGEGEERPRRTQALVAAAFDVTHGDVRSRRLNDPSRDYPGDVQAFKDGRPILSAEVRAKRVSATEVISFVAACRDAEIDRAFMVVLFPGHHPLTVKPLCEYALGGGTLLTIIEREDDLLLDVFGWTDAPLASALEKFASAALNRLKEIEVKPESLQRWVSLISTARTSDPAVASTRDRQTGTE